MVHGVLEEPSILSGLYSVFFNMLDMLSIRYSFVYVRPLVLTPIAFTFVISLPSSPDGNT